MATTTQTESIPELADGDRLAAAEFERRYLASPHVRKAELIDGVVYVASPVSGNHAKPHARFIQWVGYFQMETPHLECWADGTIRLGDRDQAQPDFLLRIESGHGGRTTISDDDYVEGGPELLAEISVSSKSIDLNQKLEAYRRAGIPEYIVWRVIDRAIDWFILRDGRYDRLPLCADGLYKSVVFPGLCLDAGAMIRGDLAAVFQAVQLGVATPEHAAFVAKLHGTGEPL